ncbi:hypothetical protein [uncultured Hyphomicrobium sp.]|uniref:hypothetical protein n=1 Tax=uncultured Hyphomicrobium sp. TaxID=194373 RepID=UPI0025D3656B|nr:hypothetical protein [uncultured Hyphomicrobium sp.]
MNTSLITKLTIAAAATMITLSPALADYRGNSYKKETYGSSYGYKDKRHYYGDRFDGPPRWRYAHRHHWKPRFYGWRYAYRPYHRDHRDW